MDKLQLFNHYAKTERLMTFGELLRSKYSDFQNLQFLEIGAGVGGNISTIHDLGIGWSNITVNEMLPDRLEKLRKNFPDISVVEGDASLFRSNAQFDIILQSLVFTSVLSNEDRMTIANNMWAMLKPGGSVLWYDFSFNNPSNSQVRKVDMKELKALFPAAKSMVTRRATLAPPVGRLVGKQYARFNALFPFLRTHLVALITK